MFLVPQIEIPQNNQVSILVPCGNFSRTSGSRQPSMTMREPLGLTEVGHLALLSSLRPHPTISFFRPYSYHMLVPLPWASSLRFSERVMPPPTLCLPSRVTPRHRLARLCYTARTGTKSDGHPIYRDPQENAILRDSDYLRSSKPFAGIPRI